MKTSKLICALLLALLLQTTFAQISLASKTTITAGRADMSNSAAAQNLRAKGPKNPNAVSAAKKIKDGFLEVARSSCKAKGGSKCKPQVPALGIKGTPEIAEELKEYWQTRKRETYEDTEAQRESRKTLNIQNNLRKLFSANNKYPNIDEGDILAWQNNYLYILMAEESKLKIIKINETTLTSAEEINILPDQCHYDSQVLVSGDVFALICDGPINNDNNTREVIIRLYRHQETSSKVMLLKQFRREGYFVSAREMDGYLHVVTQYYKITDLSWSVSGVGNVGANLNFCASWDGNGGWIRNIAAISLSFNPTYTFDAYLGCDQTAQASLAPSGSWYIAGADDVPYYNQKHNTIIQKVHRIQPSPSQWVGLPGTTLYPFHDTTDLNEYDNCTLRVAGYSWTDDKNLNLFAFDCRGFDQIATSGFVGPSAKNVQAVKWIGRNVYATFENLPQIWKYQQTSTNIVYRGKIPSKYNIRLIEEYGPNHMLAFASSLNQTTSMSVLLINLESFRTVIEYNIIPDTKFSNTILYIFHRQVVNVDFSNKRVVFPIQSTTNNQDGFYYLHIEVGPTPCMAAPPISSCKVNGTTSVQNVKLSSKVYKHWNEMGKPLLTTPTESILRSVTVTSGTKRYLYTLSRCQLQVREEPTDQLASTPANYKDLCP